MRYLTRHPSVLPSTSLANRSQLPKSPGVYYLIQWWRPWRIHYVGMSGQINRRWNASSPEYQHHKLEQAQHLKGLRIHFRVTRTRPSAQRLEAIDIMRYRPPLNGRRERIRKSIWCDAVDLVSDIGVLLTIILAVLLVLRVVQVISR